MVLTKFAYKAVEHERVYGSQMSKTWFPQRSLKVKVAQCVDSCNPWTVPTAMHRCYTGRALP